MKKLTDKALDLLQYMWKYKDGAFSKPFTASLICQRGALGYGLVMSVEPILQELLEAKVLKEVKTKLFATRYVINEKVAAKYIEEIEEEKYVQEYRDALEEEIKNYKRFVITTAVMGKEVNKAFLASIQNYAARNSALCLVLPCEDVASRGKKAKPIELSADLKDFRVIFKDTYLNKNLCLCAIKMSAKQINPLSGLDRITTKKSTNYSL